jgi:CMP-N-acetylneuraminic acid synthetase
VKVLGLIPARGGSKGVPRKNARLLCGKPLLAYTAEAALGSRRLTNVVLSTDDPEIAEIGKSCGVEVPFLRPSELADDEAPMLPVVQHALSWFKERGREFDAVCLLQPTNPLRRSDHIDGCIDLLEQSGADSVVTVLPVPAEHHPYWVYFQSEDGLLRLSTGATDPITRRQQLPAAFHREGSVYVTRCNVVLEKNSLYGSRLVGFQLDRDQSVNIDAPADWELAERLIGAFA